MKTSIYRFIFILLLIPLQWLPAQSRATSTRVISTQGYDIIEARGPIDIQLKKGTEGQIAVTTRENLHPHLKVASDGSRLEIYLKRGLHNKRNIRYTVTIPFQSLSKISLSGSGVIHTEDPIHEKTLEVKLSGSGDIDLDLETEKTAIEVNGSGDINLCGSSKNLDVKISGSARLNSEHMESQNTAIKISGSGSARVVAQHSLKAKISGSGNIRFKGNPNQMNHKVSGSGTISTLP